jgi:glycosyltransferase involved in cell wall biosynthesis
LSLSKHYDVTLIAVHPKEEVLHGVRIIPFTRYKNKLLRILVTWFVMLNKAWKVNAEIYQIHDPELIPCGLLLKWFGKKVILDIHENIAEDIFDKPWIKNKKLLYTSFAFFEKLAIKNFYFFLAEHSYADRYQLLGANYSVILNYYDAQFFKSFCETDRIYSNRIFYIGILLRSRGILEIAEAIYILKQRGMVVHFDVVGELYTGLDEEIDGLPFISEIKSQLHFHGRLPLEAGYEISRKAAVGMCIIHPMKNSIGSYPTKMFEFMAIGLPQVISNFPLYRSVVEKHACGICVDPMSPAAIADGIELILTDREQAVQMSERAVQAAEAYVWDTEFAKALQVYRMLEKKEVPGG